MAGCSSNSQRLAGPAPWSSAPQQHARAFGQQAAPETTGAIPPRNSVQSQALPPVGAQPAQAYAPQPSANWTPPPSRLAAQPAPAAPTAPPQFPSRQSQPLNRQAMAAVPVPPAPPPARPARTPERPAPAAWTAGAAPPASHTVAAGDSVVSVARRYNVTPQALAAANQLGPSDRVRVGQTLVVPQPGQTVAQRPAGASDPAQTASIVPPSNRPQREAAEQPTRAERPARAERTQSEEVAAAPEAEAAPPQQPARAAAAAPQRSSTEFRWPVRGRVVTNFGRQPGGGQSDGIGIAVPAGTPVKAAENGIVAYAGNELRGYGNLVLIRHEGDWVTAYAHNSQILVRRGDTVTRGQTIARAGQTGSVSQPMLHFEIRRGSTPVNPTNHLTGG